MSVKVMGKKELLAGQYQDIIISENEQGNFTDKAVVGAAKSDAPILNEKDIKFGARIICTVNVKTYEGKTSYVCSDVILN